MKKVSVIIPVYNSYSTLSKCLESVLASTYKNLEILLIDDGSADDSLSLCRQYSEQDERIKVFHHENHGVSYTRNRGLDVATGDYVMFVDSDDTISAAWVESYAETIEQNDVDMVIGSMTEIDIHGNSHKKSIPKIGFVGKEIWKYICEDKLSGLGYIPNKIYAKGLLSDIRFDEKMTVQEDLDFAIRALEKAKSVYIIEEAGYFYYYVPAKRETPYEGLLQNQIRIYNDYVKICENQNPKTTTKMATRICELKTLCLKQYTKCKNWKPRYDFLKKKYTLEIYGENSRNNLICELLARGEYRKLYRKLKIEQNYVAFKKFIKSIAKRNSERC